MELELASTIGGIKEFLRNTPLRPLVGVARRVATVTTNIRGERVVVDGRPFRFLVGSAPPAVEPPPTDWVRHADYHMSRAFMRAIKPGDCVADVGAFCGSYSVLAAGVVGPSGRVFAFEPASASRPLLLRNLALNGFQDRVEVCPFAASDRRGDAAFYMAGASSENSLYASGVPSSRSDDARVTRVPTVDLDGFFAELGVLPNVLKIDTEGAELAVLRGAEKILAAGATVICELHPYAWEAAGHSQDDLVGWLGARRRSLIDLRTKSPASGVLRYGPYALVPGDGRPS